MFHGNIWIIIVYLSIFSFVEYMLTRAFIGLLVPLKPVNALRVGFSFVSKFALHFLFLQDLFGLYTYFSIILAVIVNAMIIYTIASAKLYHIVLGSVIYTFAAFSADMLVMVMVHFSVEAGLISESQGLFYGFIILLFVIAPLAYCGLRGLEKYREVKRGEKLTRLQIAVTIYALVLATLTAIFMPYLPAHSLTHGIDSWIFPFCMLIFAMALFAGNDFLHIQSTQRLEAREYEALQQYMKDMESQSREVQKFRHDYLNILISMEGYLSKCENKELKDFFDEKIKATAGKLYLGKATELQNINNIEIKEIKSILLIKLQQIISRGISVEFEAPERIKSIKMDTIVMVRIIGILLDNAMEEAMETEEKLVNVGMIKDKDDVIFYVSNSCREEKSYTPHLGNKFYSTKGMGRGIGLHNLDGFSREVDNLFVETKIENKRFTQIITIGG